MPGRDYIIFDEIKGIITPLGILNAELGLEFNPIKDEIPLLPGIELMINELIQEGADIVSRGDIFSKFGKMLHWLDPAVMSPHEVEKDQGLFVISGRPNSLKSFAAASLAEDIFAEIGRDHLDIKWNEPVEDKKVLTGVYFPICDCLMDSTNIVTSYIKNKTLMTGGTSKSDELIFRSISLIFNHFNLLAIGTFNDGGNAEQAGMVMGAVDGFLWLKHNPDGYVHNTQTLAYRSRKAAKTIDNLAVHGVPIFVKYLQFMMRDIRTPRSLKRTYSLEAITKFLISGGVTEKQKKIL